jgi:membrane-associated protein
VTILGYFLGQVAFVKSNIEFILVGIVLVSLIPVVVELLRGRRRIRGSTDSTEPTPASRS